MVVNSVRFYITGFRVGSTGDQKDLSKSEADIEVQKDQQPET